MNNRAEKTYYEKPMLLLLQLYINPCFADGIIMIDDSGQRRYDDDNCLYVLQCNIFHVNLMFLPVVPASKRISLSGFTGML